MVYYDRLWKYRLMHTQNLPIKCLSRAVTSYFPLFSSPDPKVSYCHHWASVVRPSVNFSHFNQLLWSQWANLNQTLVEWSLDGPLPKLCPVIPTSNQDGRQAENRKKGMNFLKNLLLWNYWANLNQTMQKWSLGGPLSKLCPAFQTSDQDGHHSRT